MVKWRLVYTLQALKDAKKLQAAGLREKATELLSILETNPFQTPPPYTNAAHLKGCEHASKLIEHFRAREDGDFAPGQDP